MTIEIIILAAGKGTRMTSNLPKVLHPIGGIPMLGHVVHTAQLLQPERIHIVYGNGGKMVREALESIDNVNWIKQTQQLGTGHALAQALPHLQENSTVLVLYGDVPLITSPTLQQLCQLDHKSLLNLLVAQFDDPTGLGRIIRNNHNDITAIVEDRDANAEQRQINEIYTGIMAVNTATLKRWIPNLQAHNKQGELYLTDVVAMAVSEGGMITSVTANDEYEVRGVNNPSQLTHLERHYQRRMANRLLDEGVMLADPNRFDVRGRLSCQPGVSIDVNVIIEGTVEIGRGSSIGANCILRDVVIGEGVHIHPNSLLEGCIVNDNCRVGPFARLRPGTHLHNNAHIGNFVEVKKSQIGTASKVNHLSYIGDATIGNSVNVGAGTITCNYDGEHKHQTIIEDDAFIGSGTQLVAPVRIGTNATIGAGSTIRSDAPPNALTLSGEKQKSLPGWRKK